jgi:hypothetical protein
MLIQRAQGCLDAAALTCEQALGSLATSGQPPPAAGLGYVGLAEIAYQRDELDVALRNATEGRAVPPVRPHHLWSGPGWQPHRDRRAAGAGARCHRR